MEENTNNNKDTFAVKTMHISDMFENWFLDYASTVILERSIPNVSDGLKPVQRRILHSMEELEDGRYNKVANIVGNTMKYHPHGDASIGEAIVNLGQKDLLIDTQGNWGNILTGDGAAAPRYIEARLTPFAKEVVFNDKTTQWQPSYDGRNKEPVTLPIKFPLLLAQGTKGVAVGMSTEIMPHNFNEILDACIAYLKKEDFVLLPDFPTGGKLDASKYNDGLNGSRLRIRAKINKIDNKTLSITEIPYNTTTDTVIESIVAANNKGKIKIKKIDDNTARNVEIIIQLAQGVSPDKTIDGLYAFTNCEVSISPITCVIVDDKPCFLSISEILKISTDNTVELLFKELTIRKNELLEALLYASLERIFIENRIYRQIEECKTWETIISTIDKGLEPYKSTFYREITIDDITKLTEIQIKKISKYDLDKEAEKAKKLNNELKEIESNLNSIVDYAIKYFTHIKEKYGKDKERKTLVSNFDSIDAKKAIALSNKLYINREEGFAGTSLKKYEYICDCSDIDDIITVNSDGTYKIQKVSEKFFVGKDVIYINVFNKNDDRTIYNVIYRDGKNGTYFVKRFPVTGITLDKEYNITQGKEDSKIVYFNARPNGEAETIKVTLKSKPRMKTKTFEYEFKNLAIKNRNAKGNIFSKNPIKNIVMKDEGISTLSAQKIWFDESSRLLNADGHGIYLGTFEGDDKIFYATQDGYCHIINFDMQNHFSDRPIVICKHHPQHIYSVIYYSGDKQKHYVKRFTLDNEVASANMLDDDENSKLINIFIHEHQRIALVFSNNGKAATYNEIVELDNFIDVKSVAAKGKRLTDKDIEEILLLPSYYPENTDYDDDVAENDDNDTAAEANPEYVNEEEENNEEDETDDENTQYTLF